MKKVLISIGVICITLTLSTSKAFSWDPATHPYLANLFGKQHWYLNLNEMKGSMMTDYPLLVLVDEDIPNDVIPSPPLPLPSLPSHMPRRAAISLYLHYLTQDKANWQAKLLRLPWWKLSKRSFVWGGGMHNDHIGLSPGDGADVTAHLNALAHQNPFFTGGGFVTTRAAALCGLIPWVAGAYPYIPPEARLDICHLSIEAAVGTLIGQLVDPAIGSRVLLASWLGTPSATRLLKQIFAPLLAAYLVTQTPPIPLGDPYYQPATALEEAKRIIEVAAGETKRMLMLYGLALILDSTGNLLAETFLATIAPGLGINPADIPDGDAAAILTLAKDVVSPPYPLGISFPDGLTWETALVETENFLAGNNYTNPNY